MAAFHLAAMWLMIGSAIIAAACCLVAGRIVPHAVPWQARQSAVVMALGMVLLCADGGDARAALLVTAGGIVSAMLGVMGIRGRVHAGACFHRALGCVVMAVCALALLDARSRQGSVAGAATDHFGHGVLGHGAVVPMSFAAAAGVVGLLGLMLVTRVRHHGLEVPVEQEGRQSVVRTRFSLRSATGRAALRTTRQEAHGGRILLDAESVAMAVSLAVMGVMALAI